MAKLLASSGGELTRPKLPANVGGASAWIQLSANVGGGFAFDIKGKSQEVAPFPAVAPFLDYQNDHTSCCTI